MKKKIIALAMCIVLGAASMVACGDSKKDSDTDTEVSQENSTADMQGTIYKSKVTLGEYKGLKCAESDITATEEDVNKQLDYILTSFAEDTKIEEGAVEDGDKANIDFVGKMNGVAFEGGSSEGYNLEIGSGAFIDGFESGLIGHNVGEEVVLNLKFPDDYKNSDGTLSDKAGKDVEFTVKINYITRSIKPELTDTFVKEKCISYGRVETVDALKEYVADEIVVDKKLTRIWPTFLENSTVEYDEDEVEDYAQQMKQQYSDYYESYNTSLSDYLEYAGMTEEQFMETIRDNVRSTLKGILIVMNIAREEGIEVTEEEYMDEASISMEENNIESLEEFQKQVPKQEMVDSILYYKTLKWVAEQCVTAPDAEFETTATETKDTTAAGEASDEETTDGEAADTESTDAE